MSSEIEYVSPTTVDGLEFYVSLDGTKAGMSQAALSRLCGVNRSSMFDEGKLIWKLAQSDNAAKSMPECLKPFQGRVFETQLKGRAGGGLDANIVHYEACAAIVQYYATESKAANNIARYSLSKFVTIGMMSWIKQVTGFNNTGEEEKQATNNELLAMMQQVIGEVQSLKAESREYRAIRYTTIEVFPRLDEMLVDIAQQEEQPITSEDEDLITLGDWLAAKGITLGRSQMHSFASLVAQTYRTMTGRDPATLLCENKRGYKTIKRNAYKACEYPVLDIALKKLF